MKLALPWSACVALLAVLVAACAGDSRLLTGTEINNLTKSNTIYLQNRDGTEHTAHLRGNGTARVRASTGGGPVQAKWHIQGDTVCHDLRKAYKCYRVWAAEDDEDAYSAQSLDKDWLPRLTVKTGNREHL